MEGTCSSHRIRGYTIFNRITSKQAKLMSLSIIAVHRGRYSTTTKKQLQTHTHRYKGRVKGSLASIGYMDKIFRVRAGIRVRARNERFA
jgi:hypothetical protein